MQVMETCSPEKSQPNLITCVNVEAVHESDAHALLPAISDTAQRELAPAEIPADTLYGGDDNLERAKELDIEVISPVMSSPATISLSDFRFSCTDEMTACPAGRKPKKIKTGKNQGRVVHFDSLACDQCPVKRAKRSCSISYDAKALRLARRRTREKTACFREKYRFRAGIEATMSDLARITGIKHLRVRGMPQVRLAAVLKATGLNILRASTFKRRQKTSKPKPTGPNFLPNRLAYAVKELMELFRGYPRQLWKTFFTNSTSADDFLAQAV